MYNKYNWDNWMDMHASCPFALVCVLPPNPLTQTPLNFFKWQMKIEQKLSKYPRTCICIKMVELWLNYG